MSKLSVSLRISLAQAANVLKGLNTTPIDGFITFAKDYRNLGNEKALRDWNFIDKAEFRLLNTTGTRISRFLGGKPTQPNT